MAEGESRRTKQLFFVFPDSHVKLFVFESNFSTFAFVFILVDFLSLVILSASESQRGRPQVEALQVLRYFTSGKAVTPQSRKYKLRFH